MLDLDTIGYYLFMSSQEEKDNNQEDNKCDNESNESNEADALRNA